MNKTEQNCMAMLESRIASLEAQLADFEVPGSPVTRRDGMEQYGIPNQPIRFCTTEGIGTYIEVRLKDGAVEIRASGQMVMRPSGGGWVAVTVEAY